jgi:DNA-binding transcriptional LysR family regulator
VFESKVKEVGEHRHDAARYCFAMTLDQLKVFVAVAERQHLTHAARDLNLAQSAASHAISTLEDEFQVKLFDRVGRNIELTAAGRLLLEEARGILARAATARLKMSAATGNIARPCQPDHRELLAPASFGDLPRALSAGRGADGDRQYG